MSNDDPDIPAFQPVTDYKRPAMPTEETFRRWWRQVRMFAKGDEEPAFERPDMLQSATLEQLDEIVAPPACGPLLRELDATLHDWIADPSPPIWLRVVIMPPCDEMAVVEAWAREHGHQVLAAPERDDLVSGRGVPPPDLDGEGLLVIPQLERWFLRSRVGLGTVRALLARLVQLERHCVVGCNSWAWEFLAKAASVNIMLPPGLTFVAFDAGRLRTWFAELAAADGTHEVVFRLPKTGEDVLGLDHKGKPKSDYLEKLASRSLGVPWVAWHLWRTSLRAAREKADGNGEDNGREPKDKRANERTLWVAELEDYPLPTGHEQDVLLVLHALLLHGSLTAAELAEVLPAGNWQAVLPALLRIRLMEKAGEGLRCAPGAYPAIRDELAGAGFSMDHF